MATTTPPFVQATLDAMTVPQLVAMLQEYRQTAYAQLHQIQDTINAKNTPLDAPVISPNGGSFTGTESVTIASPVGTTIYYTIDGSTPTTASTAYAAPISISATTTVSAITTQTGYITSSVADAVFTLTS